jgi:hypothetical protein
MEDAAFRRERLQTAVTRLRDRLHEVKRQEENERRWTAYEKAKAERDKLAEELKAIYRQIETQVRGLLPRIAANDQQIEYINDYALPTGADRLLVAELVARDLRGFMENSMDVARITQHLRLPSDLTSTIPTHGRDRDNSWLGAYRAVSR